MVFTAAAFRLPPFFLFAARHSAPAVRFSAPVIRFFKFRLKSPPLAAEGTIRFSVRPAEASRKVGSGANEAPPPPQQMPNIDKLELPASLSGIAASLVKNNEMAVRAAYWQGWATAQARSLRKFVLESIELGEALPDLKRPCK